MYEKRTNSQLLKRYYCFILIKYKKNLTDMKDCEAGNIIQVSFKNYTAYDSQFPLISQEAPSSEILIKDDFCLAFQSL